MSVFKFFWKVWLRLNLLTTEVDNDYTAEVSTIGNTKRNEDIAKEIGNEGSEIKYDTIVSILNQRDRIERQMVQQGSSVQTGNVKLSPRVSGTWLGSSAKFDPAVHKITLDATITTEMRNALAEVGVEVLGVKDSGAYIGLVTDTLTGQTDGFITPNDDILIEGEKLKIVPEDDDQVGIFFVDDNGNSTQVTRRITQNDPKKLLARVPDLPNGEYTLQVITRYSTGPTLLNEARVIEYPKKLTVKLIEN
ncbi:DUF4469 domain-containing protein [Bacteroidales bacterium OttesenSCG-928-C19]|nr:DUF4469 domain-containing protein [Bacteroidales bacterium OttesenSCG-928-C19]